MTPTLDALVRQLREAMPSATSGSLAWQAWEVLCSPANITTLLDALAAQAMTHEREVFDATLAVARAQAERDTAVMKLAENEQLLTENYDESVKVIRRLEDRVLELEAQEETAKDD